MALKTRAYTCSSQRWRAMACNVLLTHLWEQREKGVFEWGAFWAAEQQDCCKYKKEQCKGLKHRTKADLLQRLPHRRAFC